jgi:cytochrome c-type biogenesis protein CcmH
MPKRFEIQSKHILIGSICVAVAAVSWSVVRSNGSNSPITASNSEAPGKNIEQSIAALEQKLAQNPNDADGWRMLGWSRFNIGDYAKAAEAYRNATRIAPDNGDYWSSLGESLVQESTGPFGQEAVAAFRKALTIDPKDPRARYFLGVQKDLEGDSQGAINDWIALLNDTPKGAPWEQGVRDTITKVAAEHKIDVSGRMVASAPPTPMPSSPATDAIPGPSASQLAQASSLPPSQQAEMVNEMVNGLERKLAADGRNEAGWLRLMRARMVMGQKDKAKQARDKALQIFSTDKGAVGRIKAASDTLGIPK